MIKVSVILPSLNVAAYIEETINSVIKQSLTEIEAICVDAGSTDGTVEIIQKIARKDDRIVLLSSEKRSYGYQVNKGIEYANGEYIAIVETDDFINPHMLEVLYETAVKFKVDIVKADYCIYWTQENGERSFRNRKIFSNKNIYNQILRPGNILQSAYEDWYLWTGIYRREFLLNNRIRLSETPGAAFQDIGFLHRTNAAAEKAYYIEDSCYNYCIDRVDSSSNTGKGLLFASNEYMELLKNEWSKDKLKLLYLRMARSFVSSCRITKEVIDNIEYREKYAWYVSKLEQAMQEKLLLKEDIESGIWSRLQELLTGIDQVYQNNKKKEQILFDTIGDIDKNYVVIFGCGEKGIATASKLLEKGYSIFAFMDNNRNIWGTDVDGIAVLEPEKLSFDEKRTKYIISNEVYYETIHKQLLDMNIDEIDICVYF